ncbi:MAG: zinc-binding dehydrogenase [Fimbriiglobus sp.]
MTPTAMVFTGAGRPLEAWPQVLRDIRPGQVRVKMLCCTLCRSDLSTYTGRRQEPTPTVLGHEVVGEVHDCDPEVKDHFGQPLHRGQRVTWAVVASCGGCVMCQKAIPQKCVNGRKYGHLQTQREAPDGGGLADFLTLEPGTAIFPIPETLPTTVATLANCSGATAAAVLNRVTKLRDAKVLILGGGLLGLMATAMASQAGATVILSDPNPTARERALRFGATTTIDPQDLAAHQGVDVALELAGFASTTEAAIASLRTGGQAILAGTVSPIGTIPLDPEKLVRRMLTLTGVHNYAPNDLARTLTFLDETLALFPWASLISEPFPLSETEAAFTAALQSPGTRIAVVPDALS